MWALCSAQGVRAAAHQVDAMPITLQDELSAFHRFLTVKFYGQQHDVIRDVTAQKYIDHVRCATSALCARLSQ